MKLSENGQANLWSFRPTATSVSATFSSMTFCNSFQLTSPLNQPHFRPTLEFLWCENVPCEPQASRWCNNLVFWLQSRILCVKGLKCTMWSRWPSCRRVNGIKLRCDLAGHVTHNGPQCFLGRWLSSTVTKKFAWDSSRNTNQRLLRKTTRMDHQKQPDS